MTTPIVQLISDAKRILRKAEEFTKLHQKALLIRADEARLSAGDAAAIAEGADDCRPLEVALIDYKTRMLLVLTWLEEGRQSAGKSPMDYLSECVRPLREAIRECEWYRDKGGI